MSRLRFPHPLALLVGCVLVAAILTHVLPAGQYQRRDDPATGRKVVVAGSYAAVAAKPVGPFETLVAIPKGMAVVGTFGTFVFGVVRYGWGFDQMSALFLLMGIGAGLVGGLGVTGTAEACVEGFKSMAFAALLIGVARAIYLVLDQGRIVDTIIHGLVTPLAHLPVGLFAIGMTVVQAVISVPVPSGTGQSVLTMPILVPLSDLLGLSRQVTVLAFQYGNGVVGQITPTGGALLAILAAAGVRYEHWLKFAIPLCLALFALSLAAIGVAVAVGLK